MIDVIPSTGTIVVEFLDDFDDDADSHPEGEHTSGYGGPQGGSNKACAAQCLNVGKKVDACKKGDVVLVRESARAYAIELSDDTCIVNQYDVVGVVKKGA